MDQPRCSLCSPQCGGLWRTDVYRPAPHVLKRAQHPVCTRAPGVVRCEYESGLIAHDLREVHHEVLTLPSLQNEQLPSDHSMSAQQSTESTESTEPTATRGHDFRSLGLAEVALVAQESLENAQLDNPPLSARVYQRLPATANVSHPPTSRHGVGISKALKRVARRFRGQRQRRVMLTV